MQNNSREVIDARLRCHLPDCVGTDSNICPLRQKYCR